MDIEAAEDSLGLKRIGDLSNVEDGDLTTVECDIQAGIISDNIGLLLNDTHLQEIMGHLKLKRLQTDYSLLQAELAKKTKVVIALNGETGSGKSSLINSLLGFNFPIASVSGTGACTSCIIEFAWNHESNDPRFEIEFLSRDEWLNQIRIFREDVSDEVGADAILKAVYPDLFVKSTNWNEFTDEELLTYGNLGEFIGTMYTATKPMLVDMVNAMKTIIAPTFQGGQQCWPVIKLVKVYLRADVLSTGAVIVDLPGVGDMNPVRNRIASTYELKANYLFIAAIQSRAADKLNNLAFIATHSDIFKASEIIDGSAPETQAQYKDLSSTDWNLNVFHNQRISQETAAKKAIKQLRRRLKIGQKKIQQIDLLLSTQIATSFDTGSQDTTTISNQHNDDEESSEDESSDERERLPHVTLPQPNRPEASRQETIDDDMNINVAYTKAAAALDLSKSCALYLHLTHEDLKQARSTVGAEMLDFSSQKRVLSQLATDLKNSLKSSKLEVLKSKDAMVDFCSDERNRTTQRAFNDSLKTCLNGSFERAARDIEGDSFDLATFKTETRDYVDVQVFCTSTQESTRGYESIKKLRNYVRSLTVVPQYQLSSTILGMASALISSLRNITAVKFQNTKDIQKSLKVELPLLEEALATQTQQSTLRWSTIIQSLLSKITLSVVEGSNVSCTLLNKVETLAYQTIKAICLHDGEFVNRRRVSYNFNNNLILPIYNRVSTQWESVYSISTKEIQQLHKRSALESFQKTIQNFRAKLPPSSLYEFNKFANKIMAQITHKLSHSATCLRAIIDDERLDALTILQTSVQSSLQRTYSKCSSERGKGSALRMRTNLLESFDNEDIAIFETAGRQLKAKIENLSSLLEVSLETTKDECLRLFTEDFSYISPDSLSEAQIASQLKLKVAVKGERVKLQIIIAKLGPSPDKVLEPIKPREVDSIGAIFGAQKRKADSEDIERRTGKGKEKALIQ